MRHRQAVHGQRRAGLPDEQRARHGRAGGAATTAARHASRAAGSGLLPGVLFFRPVSWAAPAGFAKIEHFHGRW